MAKWMFLFIFNQHHKQHPMHFYTMQENLEWHLLFVAFKIWEAFTWDPTNHWIILTAAGTNPQAFRCHHLHQHIVTDTDKSCDTMTTGHLTVYTFPHLLLPCFLLTSVVSIGDRAWLPLFIWRFCWDSVQYQLQSPFNYVVTWLIVWLADNKVYKLEFPEIFQWIDSIQLHLIDKLITVTLPQKNGKYKR